jgi:hypothetical protein
MQTARASELSFGPVSGHRSGRIDFMRLLQGTEGAPDNFELSIVRTGGDYFTPRHRHNFDQVRVCLEGAMNWAPGKDLRAGAVGYFPEGTYYGPQKDTHGSLVMVLQMGGAAGHGFMSYRQLNAGFEALKSLGAFESGAFSSRDELGRTHRKDGYEAIWEHVNGRPVEYPPPRYDEPIVMNPANFGWVPSERGDGMTVKRLGAFGERGLAFGFLRAPRGVVRRFENIRQKELLFVMSGAVRVNGKDLEPRSAFEIDPGDEGATLEAPVDSELFYIHLPDFRRSAA